MAAFGKNWRRQLLANAARTWSCAFLHATPNIFAPQPALLTGEALLSLWPAVSNIAMLKKGTREGQLFHHQGPRRAVLVAARRPTGATGARTIQEPKPKR